MRVPESYGQSISFSPLSMLSVDFLIDALYQVKEILFLVSDETLCLE